SYIWGQELFCILLVISMLDCALSLSLSLSLSHTHAQKVVKLFQNCGKAQNTAIAFIPARRRNVRVLCVCVCVCLCEDICVDVYVTGGVCVCVCVCGYPTTVSVCV